MGSLAVIHSDLVHTPVPGSSSMHLPQQRCVIVSFSKSTYCFISMCTEGGMLFGEGTQTTDAICETDMRKSVCAVEKHS